MQGKFIPSYDDTPIYIYEMNEVTNPVGVVQIIHGMGEHAGRYENIVKFLNENGYVVFLSDHRAHGHTAKTINDIGKYDGDIFYDTVKDQIYFSELLLEKYKMPLYVIGHSFGSFIAQRYNQLFSKHSALILSGSSFMRGDLSMKFGELVAKFNVKLKGKNSKAKLITRLSFKRYNNAFEDKNWLTSDTEQQQKQRVDRYCNHTFSNNFYKYFFAGVQDIYKFKSMKSLSVHVPMLLVSGTKDALAKNGDSVRKLKNYYIKQGVTRVLMKLFKNGRHEMFNEVNKTQVYNEVLNFIKEVKEVKKWL